MVAVGGAGGDRGSGENGYPDEGHAFDELGFTAIGAYRDLADESDPVQHALDAIEMVEVVRRRLAHRGASVSARRSRLTNGGAG